MSILLVGNDIVDLKEEGRVHHPRFPKRMFSPQEYALYVSSGEDEIYLWSAWTAKEATYKFLKQINSDIMFLLDQYIYDPANETVTFKNQTVKVSHQITSDYVYCRSGDFDDCFVDLIAESLKGVTELDQSSRVRALAVRFYESLNLADKIKFDKTDKRVPYMCIEGSSKRFPISFTHHGRFVAASVLNPEFFD